MFKELVKKSRSFRRFCQDQAIDREVLAELVDLARLAPSGANLQPLKYLIADTVETSHLIFPHLGWAGYIPDWKEPVEGERPAAYVIVLLDRRIRKTPGCDHGIAAQTIMLGAREKGLGGCMIGNINRPELQAALKLPEHFEILLVLALGIPKEIVQLEPLAADGDIKYYRSVDEVHHVPKRSLGEIIFSGPENP